MGNRNKCIIIYLNYDYIALLNNLITNIMKAILVLCLIFFMFGCSDNNSVLPTKLSQTNNNDGTTCQILITFEGGGDTLINYTKLVFADNHGKKLFVYDNGTLAGVFSDEVIFRYETNE